MLIEDGQHALILQHRLGSHGNWREVELSFDGQLDARTIVEALCGDLAGIEDEDRQLLRYREGEFGSFLLLKRDFNLTVLADVMIQIEIDNVSQRVPWVADIVNRFRAKQARIRAQTTPRCPPPLTEEKLQEISRILESENLENEVVSELVFKLLKGYAHEDWQRDGLARYSAILYGPAGTGKSYSIQKLFEALEKLTGATVLFSGDGSQVMRKYVGESAKIVRGWGPTAASEPGRLHLVFIDEVHTIAPPQKQQVGSSRDFGDAGAATNAQVLAALLNLMSCPRPPNLLLLFATNFLHSIDERLLRHQRCDVHIFVPAQGFSTRVTLAKEKLSLSNAEAVEFAVATCSFTQAQLTRVFNDTKLNISDGNLRSILQDVASAEPLSAELHKMLETAEHGNPLSEVRRYLSRINGRNYVWCRKATSSGQKIDKGILCGLVNKQVSSRIHYFALQKVHRVAHHTGGGTSRGYSSFHCVEGNDSNEGGRCHLRFGSSF